MGYEALPHKRKQNQSRGMRIHDMTAAAVTVNALNALKRHVKEEPW